MAPTRGGTFRRESIGLRTRINRRWHPSQVFPPSGCCQRRPLHRCAPAPGSNRNSLAPMEMDAINSWRQYRTRPPPELPQRNVSAKCETVSLSGLRVRLVCSQERFRAGLELTGGRWWGSTSRQMGAEPWRGVSGLFRIQGVVGV